MWAVKFFGEVSAKETLEAPRMAAAKGAGVEVGLHSGARMDPEVDALLKVGFGGASPRRWRFA